MRVHLSSTSNLYSKRLSGDSLKVYNAIIDSLKRGDFTITCSISDPDAISRDLEMILSAISLGNPELFFVKNCISPSISGDTFSVEMSSIYDESTLSEKNDELNNEVDRIVEIIKKIPEKTDQIYRLNEYLSVRIAGNMNTNPEYGNAYGAIIGCEARCEGYAKAAKMILDRLGFKNDIITGTATQDGETVPHAWNVIEVDGQNYYFDFAWNAGYSLGQEIPVPLYTFLDRKTMLINHQPKLLVDNDNDDSRLFYKLHNGEIEYLSDMSNAEILSYGRHFYAVVKMPFELNEYERNYELYNWVTQTFGRELIALNTSCVYADGIGCAIIYFVN